MQNYESLCAQESAYDIRAAELSFLLKSEHRRLERVKREISIARQGICGANRILCLQEITALCKKQACSLKNVLLSANYCVRGMRFFFSLMHYRFL